MASHEALIACCGGEYLNSKTLHCKSYLYRVAGGSALTLRPADSGGTKTTRVCLWWIFGL
jgi:hypothetical protein